MNRKYVRKNKSNAKATAWDGTELCFFGCGNPAKYRQRNGRLICASSFSSCSIAKSRVRHKEIDGQSFGYWTTIEYKKPHGWLCRCVCGVEKMVKTQSLTSGKSKSCGCKGHELMSASIIKPGHQRARRSIYNNYRVAARNRGHEFKLTFDEFSTMLTENCHHCGSEPSTLWPDHYAKRAAVYYQHPSEFYYNGIDRVDNTFGYTINNCVPACKICNRSKNTMLVKEWLEWVKRLYEFQNLKGLAHGV